MENANLTLKQLRENNKWPLQTRRAGGGGYKIIGLLNATGFIETGTTNIDAINLILSSPFSDSASTAAKIANYQLFPCQRITLVLELLQRNLMNRTDSPCSADVRFNFSTVYLPRISAELNNCFPEATSKNSYLSDKFLQKLKSKLCTVIPKVNIYVP